MCYENPPDCNVLKRKRDAIGACSPIYVQYIHTLSWCKHKRCSFQIDKPRQFNSGVWELSRPAGEFCRRARELTQHAPRLNQTTWELTQLAPWVNQEARELAQHAPRLNQKAWELTRLAPWVNQEAWELTQLAPRLNQKARELTQHAPWVNQDVRHLNRQVRQLNSHACKLDQPATLGWAWMSGRCRQIVCQTWANRISLP